MSKGKKGRDSFNVALQYDRKNKVVEIRAENQDPHFYLPDVPFKKERLYILKVEIEAPGATNLQLFYSRLGKENDFPSEEDSAKYALQKGENTLFIPLLSGDLGHRLRLDPGTVGGNYRLKEFAVRSFDKTHLQ